MRLKMLRQRGRKPLRQLRARSWCPWRSHFATPWLLEHWSREERREGRNEQHAAPIQSTQMKTMAGHSTELWG